MDLYQQNPEFQIAEQICKILQSKGFEALFAGGCVRDYLLQRIPNDFDIATSATPDEIEAIFPKTISVGKNFGVMIVVEKNEQIEVATFRKDGPYEDGRRPTSIEFSQAEEDAQRRDFTVNGLFYDPIGKKVVDYVRGQEDLKASLLRAIGEPQKRFEEDHLRLLRAVRFAAQLGFEIEPETWSAVQKSKALLQTVSGERIQEEMTKLLLSADFEKGLELLFQSGLLEVLLKTTKLIFTPTQKAFADRENNKEDQWFRFFFWLRQVMIEKPSIDFFENFCDHLKFSRDLKQKSLKALQWTYEEKPFLNHPIGEILALSFDPEHLRGILQSARFHLAAEEKPNFEKFQNRRAQLGSKKPAPWVTAADLTPKLQGEKLGQALRQSYWHQLEGQIQSKSELLKMWGV